MNLTNEIISTHIGITPAGAYCMECDANFETQKWRHHFNDKHPDIVRTFPKKIPNIINILNFKIEQARKDGNILSFAKTNKLYNRWRCTGCYKTLYRDATEGKRHLSSPYNNCSTVSDTIITVKCYKLKCGRYYPATRSLQVDPQSAGTTIMETMITATNQQPPNALPEDTLPDYAMAVLPSQTEIDANPALRFTRFFSCFPPNVMIQERLVDSILTQLIEKGDITKHWIKIFDKFIATNEYFIECMSTWLASDYLNPQIVMNSDRSMGKLLDLFADMEARTNIIVHQIPANIKAFLVKFEAPRDDDNQGMEGATTWTFRNRNKSSTQVNFFAGLLCYLKVFGCPILGKYLALVRNQEYSHNEAARCGIIVNLVFELAVEVPSDGEYMPWLFRYSLFHCFHNVGGMPKLKTASTCGKVFATALYVLRQCVLGCASKMLHGGSHPNDILSMIKPVQQGHVVNLISPCIAYCRDMSSQQAVTQTSYITKNGDIICGNATFRKSSYNQFIPKVRSSICDIFTTMFNGNDWRLFLDNKHPVRVSTNTTTHLCSLLSLPMICIKMMNSIASLSQF